ncbi:four-carbon acid sugar kinase family protein [Inquilinus sp. CAU 1745]|uniref:four-carbon acid sugar kinase family protein n=1 Tax=Inquilinus sp. CAU 1745 TaxID=3140369 RepID=UPI00325BAEC7
MKTRPEIVFCADDFTGASDTLATLVRRGLDARLYLRPPNVADNPEMADLDAIGVATSLRSMPREAGARRLREIAADIAPMNACVNHLKVCSTFDSSPEIGNIAAAADAFADATGARWIAIVGGQPSLGRYCLFGHLFATAADQAMHRIDRHPVMSVHPITPMSEADLRLHLRRQGWERIGLVAYPEYRRGAADLAELIEERQASGERRTLFDISCEDDLAVIGAALRRLATRQTVLCIGGSSVAEAMCPREERPRPRPRPITAPPPSGPVFVFAGSRSAVTAEQVRRASSYVKIPVAPAALSTGPERTGLVERCRTSLAQGSNVLAYLIESDGPGPSGRSLAEATAGFVEEAISGARICCLAIAGGDTSSIAVERLDVVSISVIADFDHGVPLVRAHAANRLDGLPMILKGGQMGSPDIFDRLACGTARA